MRTNRRFRARIASIALMLAAACSGSAGGFSGRYEADLGEGKAVLDFQGGNKVNVSLVAGSDSLTHHCVYTITDDKMLITTDEPMGVPMHLIIEGGELKDTSGGVVYKKK